MFYTEKSQCSGRDLMLKKFYGSSSKLLRLNKIWIKYKFQLLLIQIVAFNIQTTELVKEMGWPILKLSAQSALSILFGEIKLHGCMRYILAK